MVLLSLLTIRCLENMLFLNEKEETSLVFLLVLNSWLLHKIVSNSVCPKYWETHCLLVHSEIHELDCLFLT